MKRSSADFSTISRIISILKETSYSLYFILHNVLATKNVFMRNGSNRSRTNERITRSANSQDIELLSISTQQEISIYTYTALSSALRIALSLIQLSSGDLVIHGEAISEWQLKQDTLLPDTISSGIYLLLKIIKIYSLGLSICLRTVNAIPR